MPPLPPGGTRMTRQSLFSDAWDGDNHEEGTRHRSFWRPDDARMGATLYDLAPDAAGMTMHMHFGAEEMFFVLSGRPVFRNQHGEEELAPGDFVFCPEGRAGLHAFSNPAEEPAQLLAISAGASRTSSPTPSTDTHGWRLAIPIPSCSREAATPASSLASRSRSSRSFGRSSSVARHDEEAARAASSPGGCEVVILRPMRGEPSSPRGDHRADESAPAAEARPGFGDLRHYVPPDLLNASFPVAMRGYDRAAVESYVKRANRVIAELKVSSSPRAAVTHALEQTEQQVSGLLQRARETGEEITASARQEGEEIIGGAKAEAETLIATARTEAEDILVRSRLEAEKTAAHSRAEAEERSQQLQEELAALRDEAETRMRELHADTEAVWKERRQLLEDIRGKASGLLDLADAAAVREPAESE